MSLDQDLGLLRIMMALEKPSLRNFSPMMPLARKITLPFGKKGNWFGNPALTLENPKKSTWAT